MTTAAPTRIDARALSKLRWRCRRGLLENDLLLERFFARHGSNLTVSQMQGLSALIALDDHDLLDLLLKRKKPTGNLDCPEALEVLGLIRP
ncbi:MAG: succinate dehydrogenase assembly factor 2 [Burkholderiaceae bacterium]|jgi:succinate dehydrogenase flavin-adding protein (antitoxin of CptAB toxin-antitoxin module)|nr:succinate dehydrogenase assembly factor 2 [Burkholderiaceae bacterium]